MEFDNERLIDVVRSKCALRDKRSARIYAHSNIFFKNFKIFSKFNIYILWDIPHYCDILINYACATGCLGLFEYNILLSSVSSHSSSQLLEHVLKTYWIKSEKTPREPYQNIWYRYVPINQFRSRNRK